MKEQIYEAVLDWGVYYTSFAVTRQNVKPYIISLSTTDTG